MKNPFCIDNINVLGGSMDNSSNAILVHLSQFVMANEPLFRMVPT
jgi:hypothetical protein